MTTPDTLIVERSPVTLLLSAVYAGFALFLVWLGFGIGMQGRTSEAAIYLAGATLLLIGSAVGVRGFLLHKIVMVLDGETLQNLDSGVEFRWDNVASAMAIYARGTHVGVAIKLRNGVGARTKLTKNGLWGLVSLVARYDFVVPTTALKGRPDDIVRAILLHVRDHGGDVSQNSDVFFREPIERKPFTFEEKKLAVFCAAFILAVFGVVIAMAQWHEHRIEAGQTSLSTQP